MRYGTFVREGNLLSGCEREEEDMKRTAFILSAISAALATAAHAEQVTSRYTDLDLDRCTLVEHQDEGGYWRYDCGPAFGYRVEYTVFDARDSLSLIRGNTKIDLPSWEVTNGAFNSLGTKLEWRGVVADGEFRPFAQILRVLVSIPTDEGDWDQRNVLMVSKIQGDTACLVGTVDARVHADANARARQLADSRARSFRCGTDAAVAE